MENILFDFLWKESTKVSVLQASETYSIYFVEVVNLQHNVYSIPKVIGLYMQKHYAGDWSGLKAELQLVSWVLNFLFYVDSIYCPNCVVIITSSNF